MFEHIKQHRRLFICLIIIPVVSYVIVFGLFGLALLNSGCCPSGSVWLYFMLAIGIIVGCLGGPIGVSAWALLYFAFPKWAHLRRHSAIYAICWLVPFCSMSAYAFVITFGILDSSGHISPSPQSIICPLALFVIVLATLGGVAGILVFFATQLLWLKGR